MGNERLYPGKEKGLGLGGWNFAKQGHFGHHSSTNVGGGGRV